MENKKEAILKKHGIYPGFKSTYGYEEIKAAMDEHSANQNEELIKENEELRRINETVILDRNLYRESFEKLQSTIDEKNKEADYWKQRCEAAEFAYQKLMDWYCEKLSVKGFEESSMAYKKWQEIKDNL